MSAKMTAALSSPREPVFVVRCTGVAMNAFHQVGTLCVSLLRGRSLLGLDCCRSSSWKASRAMAGWIDHGAGNSA